MVNVFTGEPVECRRSRLKCAGVHACEELDKGSYHTERFELDPNSLRDFVDAQINSRLEEGDTPEKRALVYVSIILKLQSLIPLQIFCVLPITTVQSC